MARHGENIRLRTDGRWEARALVKLPGSSKNTYRYFYGRSYLEAKQKRAAFAQGCAAAPVARPAPRQDGTPIIIEGTFTKDPPADRKIPVTFEDAARKWLAAKKPLVKKATYAHYVIQAEKHLLPELGTLPLGELDSVILEDFIMHKLESGSLYGDRPLSPSSVSNLKVILRQILKYAKSHGMLDSIPECPAVPCPQPRIKVLTVEEQERLVDRALFEDTEFILGVLIALYAGLRIGEACALQWGDFDFTSGIVAVRKTVMRIRNMDEDASAKTKAFIDAPKTACSIREIPLTDDIARYFLARKKDDDSFVMTGTGKFMEPRVCLDRYKRLLRRAGVADYNFHALRHTFATRCVEKGVDIKSLSEFMGHSDVSVTMQRYVHPSMELKKQQINKLDSFGIRGQNSWSEK